jgi:hypothetical protein
MYTSLDFSGKIATQRGSLVPQRKGVSYTNFVSGLVTKFNFFVSGGIRQLRGLVLV